MIYTAANSIAIKKNQDRIYCDSKRIILCDGIGAFDDSEKAAELAVENLKYVEIKNEIFPFISKTQKELFEYRINGGTTVIFALINNIENIESVNLSYLGNGSIYHFHGDFFEQSNLESQPSKVYRYTNMMVPHVDKEHSLLRHLSPRSSNEELQPTSIDLSLNGLNGDILFLFTDGISTLEEDMVISDNQERIWRNQSQSVDIIINDFHVWLLDNCNAMTNLVASDFLAVELQKLKSRNNLEDDASIGLIFTESVLNYYKNLSSVK